MAFLPLTPYSFSPELWPKLKRALDEAYRSYRKEIDSRPLDKRQPDSDLLERRLDEKVRSFLCGIMPRELSCVLPSFAAYRLLDKVSSDELLDEIEDCLCKTPQLVWTDAFQNDSELCRTGEIQLSASITAVYHDGWTASDFSDYFVSLYGDISGPKNDDADYAFESDVKPWRRSFRMGFPLYFFPGAAKDTIESIILIFSLFPLLTDSIPRYLTISCRYSFSPFENEPEIDYDTPVSLVDTCQLAVSNWIKVAQSKTVQILIDELSIVSSENTLACAARLLGKAWHAKRSELKIVMAVTVLEALCGLDADDQIGKSVRRCMGLLFPSWRRGDMMNQISSLQGVRNDLLHARTKNGQELGDGNAAVTLAAQCIVRRAALSRCLGAAYREISMVHILEQYIKCESEDLKKALDDDILKSAWTFAGSARALVS